MYIFFNIIFVYRKLVFLFMLEIMTVDKGNKSTEVVEKISTEVLRMNVSWE